MQKIITATGKEYTVAWAGVSTIDGLLRFEAVNIDTGTALSTFMNPVETETLIHAFDNAPKTYSGYTVFRGIDINQNNRIMITLGHM